MATERDEAENRQADLAQLIGTTLFPNPVALVPADRHSSYTLVDIPLPDWSLDERICDVPWHVIAWRLNALTPVRVIDHAWLLRHAHQPPTEPWGLVTEPYMKPDDVTALVAAANAEMLLWGVYVINLSPEHSAWNPGSCTPIVAIAQEDFRHLLAMTLPLAMGWR